VQINPALIALDPDFVGTVDTADIPQKRVDVTTTPFARLPRMERLKLTGQADLSNETPEQESGDGEREGDGGDNEGGGKKALKEKNKMRGKNKSLKRHLRKKKKNVIDPATVSASPDKLARFET
jgi:U3 small nucleolar RNA-associated protein 7